MRSAVRRGWVTAMYQETVRGAFLLAGDDRWRADRLPDVLSGRQMGWALWLALGLHAAAFAGLVRLGAPVPPVEEPIVRMVFVEPPPPARGQRLEAPAASPVRPVAKPKPHKEKVVSRPKPIAHPDETRLRHAEASPFAATPPAPDRGLEAASASSSVPPAVSAGDPRGVATGMAGGVVGGVGAAPVPAALAATAPALVRRVAPEYPKVVRQQGAEGLVVIEAILDREGRVEPAGIRVTRSVPLLDEHAVAAVRKWRFRPARSSDGSPLRVLLEIPIQFVLR